MSGKWSQGAVFKVLGIGVLALVMLIPLAEVNDVIHERQGRAQEATMHVAERWGAQQMLGGPVLVVPVKREVRRDKEWIVVEERHYLLPDRLSMTVTLEPDVRRYGIYDTAVYTADAKIEGRFSSTDIAALANDGEPEWQRAEMRVPIADVRGIRRVSSLRLGDRELEFGPDTGGVGGLTAISASSPLEPASLASTLPFSFTLTLAGTERFSALPLARRTEAGVASRWPDPGFDGAFLPATHRVGKSGFEAEWQVLDLNRELPQSWSEGAYDNEALLKMLAASQQGSRGAAETGGIESALKQSAFGVTLTQPAGTYQQNVRAGKYGVLFIALTFVAFFLFEVLRGLRVHPVQYLLIGLALSTFYVVLLALSEQIGFAWAYAIAACAVVAIVGGYAGVVLATRRAGILLGALLALIYALLYGLVVSEDYSLLMGSMALLAAVAALMYLTRRVDWYAFGPAAQAR